MFDSAAKTIRTFHLVVIAASTFFIFSCSTVKNYQANKPFIYQTNITLNGKFNTDQRKQLADQLNQQLDDSIHIEKQQKLIFWKTLKSPPVYDSINAEKSKISMHALLNSLGYYRDSISYSIRIDTIEDQYRTTVNFYVFPRILIKLDSIRYNIKNDTLEKITLESLNKSVIKKGDPFAKPQISLEFDRLSDVYRNNGYLRFSKEDLLALWDTVGLNLLRPTFDPIEQAQLLQALQQRKLNPTADIDVVLKPNSDSARLTRYYIGNVSIYTDYNADTAFYTLKHHRVGEYNFLYYQNKFKPKKFTDFIYLHKGDLYSQINYIKTQYKFNSLGAWKLVNINQLPRTGEDTADFEIRLTPAKKHSITANLEASRNQGNVGIIGQGNLLGVGATLRILNRNFAKESDQATTNFRYGTELDASTGSIFVQTKQFTASHTIEFPRVVPKYIVPSKFRENTRTLFSLNGGITDRINYYNISSFATSLTYEFNWGNKLLTIRIPNIEYNLLTRRDSLNALINRIKSYKYIFNDGLILSTIINWKIAGVKNKTTSLAQFNFESSGFFIGLLNSPLLDNNLYRFVKLDAEYTRTHKIRRTAIAWRVFGGIGYELPSNHNKNNLYLPFFREYYGGGPNSMRAWPLRKLGPGSTILSYASNQVPDRFGDIRLESNLEYRYYMTRLFGFNVEGALFTDMGNIWFLRANPDFIDGEFRPGKLWKDIAIGTGTGVRIDFGFLKGRLDYAYKVKNPSPENIEEQNKWFYGWKLTSGQLQLGIDYPF